MAPNDAQLDPYGTRVSLSYVADPDGGKVEMLEWLDLDSGWPGDVRPEGVNHVAFGVESLDRAKTFWSQLDFGDVLFESDGYFEPMHPWYPGEPPRQKMLLLTNPQGAGLEPVEHIPPSPDMRGRWGRLGPFEFAVGVRHLERGIERLCELGVAAPLRAADDRPRRRRPLALRLLRRSGQPVRLAVRDALLSAPERVSLASPRPLAVTWRSDSISAAAELSAGSASSTSDSRLRRATLVDRLSAARTRPVGSLIGTATATRPGSRS